MKWTLFVFATILSLGRPFLVGAQSVELREIAVTKGDPSQPFGLVSDAILVSDEEVWIADEKGATVWKWDPRSQQVRRVLREGEGPGEVKTPVRFAARPGGGLALYDVGQSAVNLFDQQLRFIRRVLLPGIVSYVKDMLVLGDGSIVMAGGQIQHHNHIHRFSEEGVPLERWGQPPPDAKDISTRIQTMGGALAKLHDGTFLLSLSAPLRILVFPEHDWTKPDTLVAGTLLPEMTDEAFLVPLEGRGLGFRWDYDKTTGVFRLENGHILNVVTREDRQDSVWDVYSSTGELLGRTEIGVPYNVRQYVEDGIMLATRKDPITDESVVVLLEVGFE